MRVILNPMARHGAGRRLQPSLERALGEQGLDFDIVLTDGPGHAVELARGAAEAGIDRVVAAGGDDTVHEVANGLMKAATPAALGLIPIGTGNDFVKMVPGSATRAESFRTLATGALSPMDVGVARWDGHAEYFMNAMGTGVDVEVVRQMRRSDWLPGTVIYLGALLRALRGYRPMQIRIDVDGEVITGRIMLLAVCNGPSIGGSFRICPDARPDDGILDVCLVRELPIHRIMRVLPRVLRGTHARQEGVSMSRGSLIRLSAGGAALPFQLDGELRETEDDIHVSLAGRKLNVIRRADARAGAEQAA
jgi:YegS/Rv2252/BmrU family lipid kinase